MLYGAAAAELGSTLTLTNSTGGLAVGHLLGKQNADLNLNLPKLAELSAPTQLRAAHVVMSGGNPLINYNADLQVVYDPAANTYSFNTDKYTQYSAPAISVGPAQRDAARSTAAETVYNIGWPSHTGTVRVYNATSATAPVQLTYTSFATISFAREAPPGAPPSNKNFLAYLMGIQTPRLQMPTTGSASYAGVIGGGAASYGGGNTRNYDLSGTSSFTMDFGTSALTGQLNILGADMVSGAIRDFGSFAVSGQVEGYSANASGFAGARGNITGTNVDTGVFQGNFFGPRGVEFGGVFELRQRVFGGDDTHFNGVTVAKQCPAAGC